VSDFMPDNPAQDGPARFAPRPEGAPPRGGTGEPTSPATTASPGPAHAARPAGSPGPAGSPPFAPPPADPVRQDPPRADGAGPEGARPDGVRPTAEVKGRIHIADEVVEKVAALAATEVPGVADLGGDLERAIESVRERIGLGNKRGDQGVKADVKGHEVAISVTIMVEYGHVVLEVARRVQVNVARTTHRMLGLKVVEVNVTVDDVRTMKPEPDDQADDAA
jgi:uncharacterized alkaline shock family protein YloU